MPPSLPAFPDASGSHATRTKYSTATTCPFQPRHCGLDRTIGPQITRESLAAAESQVMWRYVVAGSLWWEESGTRTQIWPGQVLARPQPSRGRLVVPQGHADVLWIVLQGAAACTYFEQVAHRFGSVHALSPHSETVQRAIEMVRAARRNVPRSPFFWSDRAYLWLSTWHRELTERHPPPAVLLASRPDEEKLRVLAPRRVKNFAAEVGYSAGHLTRIIRRTWRQTPGRVLRRVRLEEAARLLRDTPDRVAAVAAQVGYASVPAFITAFKAKYGRTPLVYRREQL